MFQSRDDAGERLGAALSGYDKLPGCLVLGLPRGGVIAAWALSRRLNLPLDVFISQKICAPEKPQLALGAVAETGSVFLNRVIMSSLDIPFSVKAELAHMAQQETEWRLLLYRGGRPLPAIAGRTIILVDDGVVTGATFLAAVEALVALMPKRLIAALPVGPAAAIAKIQRFVDELVVLERPVDFDSLASFYEEFRPVPDDEVLKKLSFRRGHEGLRRHAFAQTAATGAK